MSTQAIPTTRRSLLQAMIAMLFGLFAPSAFADADDRKREKYLLKSMHIPIGMAIHADDNASSKMHLPPGVVAAGKTATLSVIRGSPAPMKETYTIEVVDHELSLGGSKLTTIMVHIATGERAGYMTISTKLPTDAQKVVFLMKSPVDGSLHATDLKII